MIGTVGGTIGALAVAGAGAHGFLMGRRGVFPAPLVDRVLERRRRQPFGPWTVTTVRVSDPLDVGQLTAAIDDARPVLTCHDVHDLDAVFVADPFVVHDGHLHHLFVEVMERSTGRGVIAAASSHDGRTWVYRGEVLREDFHLSYPQVFAWDGRWWMVPETNEDRTVRIYSTDQLPGGWRFDATLLRGHRYVDASVFRHADRWWMLVSDALDEVLNLFVADTPTGPWVGHPCNPVVVNDPRRARPGGRVLERDGRLVRFAQDDAHSYGRAVRAFEIVELTPTSFAERPLGAHHPILGPGRSAWNRAGMHHIDMLAVGADDWLVAVDGRAF